MSSTAETVATHAPAFVTLQQVQRLYGVCGAFLALAVIAVACRALVLHAKRSWGRWDDWTMFVCILPTAALAAAMCLQGSLVYDGPGQQDPFAWIQRVLIDTWVIQILVPTSLYVVKLSICIRYLRIADDLKDWFWRLSMATIIVLSTHYATVLLVWPLQCMPIRKYWNATVPGTCINQSKWDLSINGINLGTDILVLVLPVRTVWTLKLPLKQRLAVLLIFMVGGLSTVAGSLRFYYLYHFSAGPTNLVASVLNVEIWGFIEISLGIFCGCVPSFRALYTSMKSNNRRQSMRHVISDPTSDTSSTGRSTIKTGWFPGRRKESGSVRALEFNAAADDIELVSQYHSHRHDEQRGFQQSIGTGTGTSTTYARTERSHEASE